MIQLTNAAQLTNAIKRVKADRLFVSLTGIYRQYQVLNRKNQQTYMVNFFVQNGKRYGQCTCKGGERGLVCKHLAVAAALHVGIAAQRNALSCNNLIGIANALWQSIKRRGLSRISTAQSAVHPAERLFGSGTDFRPDE